MEGIISYLGSDDSYSMFTERCVLKFRSHLHQHAVSMGELRSRVQRIWGCDKIRWAISALHNVTLGSLAISLKK